MGFKYIHYTGSTTLALLGMTGLRFVGLSDLMYKHRLAPLAGEVDDIIKTLADKAEISFAAVNPDEHDAGQMLYSPQTARHYGGTSRNQLKARISSESDLIKALDALSRDTGAGHVLIQKLIADTLHAKLVGSLPSQGPLLPAESLTKYHADIEKIRKQMILSINASYIFTVLMKSIKSGLNRELQAKIQRVLATGIVPLNFITYKTEDQVSIAKKFFDAVFEGDESKFKADWELQDKPNIDTQKKYNEIYSSTIADYNFKFAFLHNILDGKIGRALSQEHLATLDEPFPIAIILTEDIDPDMKIVKWQEFRCNRDLELGKDIQYMAVDPANAKQLQDWLAKYDLLDKISLVDINTLIPISPRPKLDM